MQKKGVPALSSDTKSCNGKGQLQTRLCTHRPLLVSLAILLKKGEGGMFRNKNKMFLNNRVLGHVTDDFC